MTTIKQASGHQSRLIALFLGVWISGMGFMLSTFLWMDSIEAIYLIYCVICIVMVTVWVTVSRKWDGEFHCPDCGGAVDDALDTAGKARAPILRRCSACDVLWETGVTADD